jgi:hypothetical protein
MTCLPNAHHANVDPRKITDYLLSDSHPAGRSKAVFFRLFGFRADQPEVLLAALLEHAATAEVTAIIGSPFGVKYEISGPLGTPDGRRVAMKTIWIVEAGGSEPRFVTSYPV